MGALLGTNIDRVSPLDGIKNNKKHKEEQGMCSKWRKAHRDVPAVDIETVNNWREQTYEKGKQIVR